jgi:hypothetical protein
MRSADITVGRPRSSEEHDAEAACREVMYAYIDCADGVDGKRLTTSLELFSEGSVYEMGVGHPTRPGVRFEGKAAIASALAEAEPSIMTGRYKHLLTDIRFTLVDSSNATARSTLTAFSLNDPNPREVDCLQEIYDAFVLEGGMWRISRRVFVDLVRRRGRETWVAPVT